MDRFEFMSRMRELRKSNGRPYAEGTIISYANALYGEGKNPAELWNLCRRHLQDVYPNDRGLQHVPNYGALTVEQLNETYYFMLNNQEAKELDGERLHGAAHAAIYALICMLKQRL